MILSKLKLVENIVNEISDNSTGLISPHDIRHNLLDIIDSVPLLLAGRPVSGSNFDTPLTRSTRAGVSSLEKLGLEGYFSVDNSAFGYAALQANYQGIRNTAIGSNSLSCNIYGNDNVAVGANSLGGNTIGHGNVGIGNYSLSNQKSGSYNVAIGHAAGYYVDRETNNKLVIASHEDIGDQYICDNPLGSGLTPLIYGDFKDIKVGIGVRTLGLGTLQVSGDINPAPFGNLGHRTLPWSNVFSNNVNVFSVALTSNNSSLSGSLATSGHFVPLSHSTYDLGSTIRRWRNSYFDNIFVQRAEIQKFISYENCEYSCKTLKLGSNKALGIIDGGGPNGIYEYQFEHVPNTIDSNFDDCIPPTDEELTGAGISASSSGANYARTYEFSFVGPDYGLSCLQEDNPYSRASWNSNISLHIGKGGHLRTDRVLFPTNISIVSSSGCYGLFSSNSKLFVSRENILRSSNLVSSSGHIAGIGDVNFLSASGQQTDFVFNLSSVESGVSVRQRFLTGVKNRIKDTSNNNKDKLTGFELEYIDEAGGILGQQAGRFVIAAYDNNSEPNKSVVLMRSSSDEGILGINNFAGVSRGILPETSLNIRSNNNAIARITAENTSNTKAAIQLLGKKNCLENGLEIEHLTASGWSDISTYKDSNKALAFRFYPLTTATQPRVSLFPDSNDAFGKYMFQVGSPTFPHAAIGIHEFKPKQSDILLDYSSVSGFPITGQSNRIYVALDTLKSYIWNPIFSVYSESNIFPTASNSGCVTFLYKKIAPNQSQSMFAIDSSGNRHDLFVNKFDHVDARALYTDPSGGNTYGGMFTIVNRQNSIPRHNTLLGYLCCSGLSNASGNTIIGSHASQRFFAGFGNTVVGHNAMRDTSTGSFNTILGNNSFIFSAGNSNIVVGNNAFGYVNNGSGNIVIGNNGIGNFSSGNLNFLLGSSSNSVLMHGILGPNNSDKMLVLPSGGKLFVDSPTYGDSVRITSSNIDVLDYTGNNYPDQEFAFRFIGNNSGVLLSMNHSVAPITGSATYANSVPASPYVGVSGDLRILGQIRFSDSTSLKSSSFLNNISVLESGLSVTNTELNSLRNNFNSLIVEGYTPNKIDAPTSFSSPTSGIMVVKNGSWSDTGNVTLYNRDVTSVIHSGAYVIAIRVNNQYRPLWISAADTSCCC